MIGPLIADPPDLPATLAALKGGKRNATKYRFADLAPELRAELAALLCRPPAPPPPPAATEDKPEPPILARVRAAVAEGIGPNVRRFARFQGHAPGEVIELQAIGAKDKQFTVNWFAHATDVDTAIALAEMSERVDPAERSVGVYCIGNAVNRAVATRAPIGRFHRAKKGESTTDKDILARCEGFVDIDPERPGGTSATDEQHDEALAVGARVYTDVAAIVGEDACGLGDSGNGATFKFAVDRTPIEPACEAIIKEIVASLDALYSVKGRVKIDASLTDPKRLSPCWGTTKRKGVPGLPDRPHRPTGFACSDNVRRLSMDQLVKLRDTLAARLGGDRAKATDEPAPKAETRGNGPFERANAVDTHDVAKWLGVEAEDGTVTCPGCKSTDGVAILDHGLKCHHNRCDSKGRKGFRTNVDLTMEARDLVGQPWEAVRLLAEQFGFSATSGEREAPRSPARSIADVLAAWGAEGPLVHEPTGIKALDDLTGGGPVYGTRWYLMGAPDAGKTALEVQIGDVFARRGIVVGILAVDEEDNDVVTRLAQRAGFTRGLCEARPERPLEDMRKAIGDLPIIIFDDTWTIEAAAAAVAARAAERLGARGCLLVDSIQTVLCDANKAGRDDQSPRESVTANVRALRRAATEHRLIAIATSEMNRAAYRSVEAAERADDMAAGKESGAIEFSARVLLAMRSVKGKPNLIEVGIPKNKHGPRGRDVKFHLEIDRTYMTLESCIPNVRKETADAEREKEAAAAAKIATRIATCHASIIDKLRAASAIKHVTSQDDLVAFGAGEKSLRERAVRLLLAETPPRVVKLPAQTKKLGHLVELPGRFVVVDPAAGGSNGATETAPPLTTPDRP